MKRSQRALALFLSSSLVLASVQAGYATEAPQSAQSPQGLEQLVAPIALYPDALVARMAAASFSPRISSSVEAIAKAAFPMAIA